MLLLADIFENFIDVSMKIYNLDPSHYLTASSLSLDAMLKLTGVELELLTDGDMHLFMEEGIRGGISVITNRYAKANNKYMGDNYNPNQPSTFIQYMDENSLYSSAMSQPLPVGNFQWLTQEEMDAMMSDHHLIQSCTIEVDLEYPHNDYLSAPEPLILGNTQKLVPNLYHKQKYKVHHRALRTYLNYGMKLTKIHNGIKYKESHFLGKYIHANNEARKKAKNDIEKEFYK